jgi:transposase
VKAVETAGKARRQRRTFTREFKRDLVHQTLVPGASISGIALANGLNTNQLFAWRRRLLPQATVRPAVLLPVEMEAAGPMVINSPADLAPAKPSRPGPGPYIEIAGTHATVRVHGPADPATLRTVLQWLAR